jgi:hypothetical protein
MPIGKKICLGLAFLVALGVAASTPISGGAPPATVALPMHSPHMGSDFPPPTGG